MKEFSSQDGGRYTFVDDIVNLQNLALAFSAIFDACDNFVIMGCELTGDTVSEGYVYINGKIRQLMVAPLQLTVLATVSSVKAIRRSKYLTPVVEPKLAEPIMVSHSQTLFPVQ